jgi:hypothetical protein
MLVSHGSEYCAQRALLKGGAVVVSNRKHKNNRGLCERICVSGIVSSLPFGCKVQFASLNIVDTSSHGFEV